jgi:hypothetical protein
MAAVDLVRQTRLFAFVHPPVVPRAVGRVGHLSVSRTKPFNASPVGGFRRIFAIDNVMLYYNDSH